MTESNSQLLDWLLGSVVWAVVLNLLCCCTRVAMSAEFLHLSIFIVLLCLLYYFMASSHELHSWTSDKDKIIVSLH